MKKLLYVISMFFYALSLVGAFAEFPLAFMGYFFIGSFVGSDDYAKVLTVILMVVLMLCHTFAVFKNKKYIYVTRAVLFLGSLFNLLVVGFSADMIASLIISVALLVMTFIEKTEYIISNTVSHEELTAIEKEIVEEKTNSAIGNIISFFILPIILSITIGVCAVPFEIKYVNELKEEYRGYYTDTKATAEQNAQFKNISYTQIEHPWEVDTNQATARIETKGYDDYWIINDNINIVLNLYYDSWDSTADEEILVNANYKYPDMQKDRISEIRISNEYDYNSNNAETYVCPDFTDEEKEMLRDFVFNEKYLEQEKFTLTREQYYDTEQKDVFWYFEGENTLYLVKGEISRLEDGKYYFCNGWLSRDCYPLPDEICERLEKVW